MTTKTDESQIAKHGLTCEQVEKQLDNFKNGFPFLSINRAAVIGDGVVCLDKASIDTQIGLYDKFTTGKTIVKFVPASGAATRLFKELFEYVNDDKSSATVDKVVADIEKFAFSQTLLDAIDESKDAKSIIKGILGDPLCYGSKPKAQILFHKYKDGARTAAEEHLCEGAIYASSGGKVNIHFTVSPEHQKGFEELFAKVQKSYEKRYGVSYNISFSTQKGSTDTIAVTPDNEPFRNDDGTLLFRPAGHGALIENLNEIDADIIFIKNIDNVAPDRLKPDTIAYKKVIGGLLCQVQSEIFALLERLDRTPNEETAAKAVKYIETVLCYKLPPTTSQKSLEERIEAARMALNRPLRICGMVKNDGEPGGGPFWINDEDGSQSLQIAESSQISPTQIVLMQKATHFNPVDLVCAVKDYKGHKFDLTKYVDPATGFISTKSKDGRALKAQELPGLWNGAMANWNTIFVEVPVSTFSPVKVITDLLREQHQ